MISRSKTKNEIMDCLDYLREQRIFIVKCEGKYSKDLETVHELHNELWRIRHHSKLLKGLVRIIDSLTELDCGQRTKGEVQWMIDFIAWANIKDYQIVQHEAA